MNNQDKHKYIYDKTGIEPKLWMYKYWGDGLTLSDTKYRSESYDFQIAYYPESQLWDMLPTEIDTRSKLSGTDEPVMAFLVSRKKCLGYWLSSGFSMWYHNIEFTDLHTALLDMVLWCIEQGYIKGEKNGFSKEVGSLGWGL